MERQEAKPSTEEEPRPFVRHNSRGKPWSRPTFYSQMPWDSFLALFLALCCAGGIVAVIVLSHQSSVEAWKAYRISPSVCISILTVGASIFIRYAYSHAVVIAWWVRASRRRSTVADLHRQWVTSTSLKDAVFALGSLNVAALATVALALLPAHAPLAQKASVPGEMRVAIPRMLAIPVLSELTAEVGATGIRDGQAGKTVAKLTATFNDVVQDYVANITVRTKNPIAPNTCRGQCRGILKAAAGYEIHCTPSSTQVTIPTEAPNPAGSTGLPEPVDIFKTEIVDSKLSFTDVDSDGNPAYGPHINLTTQWKTDATCTGPLQRRHCTLVPAHVEYHIVVDSSGAIRLDPAFDYRQDKAQRITEPSQAGTGSPASSLGGVYLAAHSLLDTHVAAEFGGIEGWQTKVILGNAWIRYGSVRDDDLDYGPCRVAYADPTDDMLSAVRELTFRMALAGAPAGAAAQEVAVVDDAVVLVFESQWAFLIVAVVLVALAVGCVVPVAFGWWRLARTVTLSPIEIANAFDAPLLAQESPNLTAGQIVEHAGHLPAQTIAVTIVPAAANDVEAGKPEKGAKGGSVGETGGKTEISDAH